MRLRIRGTGGRSLVGWGKGARERDKRYEEMRFWVGGGGGVYVVRQ